MLIEDKEGAIYYLFKWKGYPSAENTWEPKQHLSHAQDILKNYKD